MSAPGGPQRGASAFSAALITIAVVRFGVLAAASMALFSLNIIWFPLTLDLNAFYVAASFVSMSALVGLVCFGLYTSLGGKPLAGWTENP